MIDTASRLSDFSVTRSACRCFQCAQPVAFLFLFFSSLCPDRQETWQTSASALHLNHVLIVALSLQFKEHCFRSGPNQRVFINYMMIFLIIPKLFLFPPLGATVSWCSSSSLIHFFFFFLFFPSRLVSVRSQSFKKAPAVPTIKVRAACNQENASAAD